MHIKPFAGTVLLEPIKSSSITQGGLHIPETSQQDLKSQFRVVSVGKGKVVKLKNGTHLRLQTEMKVGQTVIANTYAGKEVGVDGKVMRIMDQTSIQAVVEE